MFCFEELKNLEILFAVSSQRADGYSVRCVACSWLNTAYHNILSWPTLSSNHQRRPFVEEVAGPLLSIIIIKSHPPLVDNGRVAAAAQVFFVLVLIARAFRDNNCWYCKNPNCE